MPVASSATQRDGPHCCGHLLPKPVHSDGQLTSAARSGTVAVGVGMGASVYQDPQTCSPVSAPSRNNLQERRQLSSPLSVTSYSQDSSMYGSRGHSTPAMLSLSPGLTLHGMDNSTRSSPPRYDHIQRGPAAEFPASASRPTPVQMHAPQQVYLAAPPDNGRKSESPSRKRRRLSLSNSQVVDLTTSPSPPTGAAARAWAESPHLPLSHLPLTHLPLHNIPHLPHPLSLSPSLSPPQQHSRRRHTSQRCGQLDRCATPRSSSRRSPPLRRSRFRDRSSTWLEDEVDRRAFQPQPPPQPPPTLPPHGPHPAFLSSPVPQQTSNLSGMQSSPASHHNIVIDVSQVPVSLPVSLSHQHLPIYTGPHIPVCTGSGAPPPHLPGCQVQSLYTCSTTQFRGNCQVPQIGTCMPHQTYPQFLHQPQHAAFSPQQSSLQVPPPVQHAHFPTHQHLPTQRQETDMEIISEHRPSPSFHPSPHTPHPHLPPSPLHPPPPHPHTHPQHHAGLSQLPPSPPVLFPEARGGQLDLLQSRSRRLSASSRRGTSRRWRGIPLSPAPHPYPGFLLHVLAMLSSPPVTPYGQGELAGTDAAEMENYEALLTLAERLGEAKPRGLAKADIDQLPSYRYNADTHQSDQTSCVICMCDFEARQLLRVLPCAHEFHAKCVDKWLKSNRTCPICRGDASEYFSNSA